MANPQPDKFARISIELLEALARVELNGQEWRIIIAIIRKTYGFNKKTDKISLSQFGQITGMDQKSICRSLKSLFYKMVITVKKDNFGNIYGLQKDYEKWLVGHSTTGETATGESATGGVATHTAVPVATHAAVPLANSPHTIDKRQKTLSPAKIFTLEDQIRFYVKTMHWSEKKVKDHYQKVQKIEGPELDEAISKIFTEFKNSQEQVQETSSKPSIKWEE